MYSFKLELYWKQFHLINYMLDKETLSSTPSRQSRLIRIPSSYILIELIIHFKKFIRKQFDIVKTYSHMIGEKAKMKDQEINNANDGKHN